MQFHFHFLFFLTYISCSVGTQVDRLTWVNDHRTWRMRSVIYWLPSKFWLRYWGRNGLEEYSSLLNNRAANLILFWKKSILHVLIPSYTFINFWIFLAKTFFYTNEKWKSPSYTALFHPTRLLIFGILPSYTFIPSYTIIKETRVLIKFVSKTAIRC